MSYPSRIVCLTEETTETLYRLGEGDRIVGISGYTVRPPEARAKPKVSAFINARFDKIEALHPDLVLAFSDLQADIAAELIRRGYPVMTFNQRTVAEILQTIRLIGGLVGAGERAEALAAELERGLDEIREKAAALPRRPRTFFEEWPDPLMHLDNRELDPPEPMVRLLAEAERLDAGEVIFAVLSREPVFLFPELTSRGHQWVGNFDATGNLYRIMIRIGSRAE